MHTIGSTIQLAHALHNTPAAPRLYLSSTHAGWDGLVAHAFALKDGVVYHTYADDPREVGFMVFHEQLLERAPKGGKEGVPVTRHDEYKGAVAASTATG